MEDQDILRLRLEICEALIKKLALDVRPPKLHGKKVAYSLITGGKDEVCVAAFDRVEIDTNNRKGGLKYYYNLYQGSNIVLRDVPETRVKVVEDQ